MQSLAKKRIDEYKEKIKLLKWRIEIYKENNKNIDELSQKIIELENYIKIAEN